MASFKLGNHSRELIQTVHIVVALLMSGLFPHLVAAQSIHLNQLGFLPESAKIAIVSNTEVGEFWLLAAEGKSELLRGPLSATVKWDSAGETVKIADFSAFNKPGKYIIRVEGLPESAPFSIQQNIYDDVLSASIKSFYFNRVGAEVEARFGGKFKRPAAHPDALVYIHKSAASKNRPVDTVLSSPKGWYDAGDYNKYIVNSGITTYTLLKAFEDFESHFASLDLNIPESKNALPDLLDEIRWNLEWMLTMQDPSDGGVYHKLTTLRFSGSGLPHEQMGKRFMFQKSTAAALNFAAVMAKTASVSKNYPEFGRPDVYLRAAKLAWQWALKNPKVIFVQPEGVNTGTYSWPNEHDNDEFFWASRELYLLTGEKKYLKHGDFPAQPRVQSWAWVETLGLFALSSHPNAPKKEKQKAQQSILKLADDLMRQLSQSGYYVPMVEEDFIWGSNSIALNKAIVLLHAQKLSTKNDYRSGAQALLDYILGKNPTGYSFVTGFGHKPPVDPHHRVSYLDKVSAPIPGMVVGGPNKGRQDKCKYSSTLPAKSYLDDWCSYASNEVAINWNAAFVYAAAGLRE